MSRADTGDDLLRIVLVIVAAFVLAPVLMMAVLMPTAGMLGWWGDAGMMGGWGDAGTMGSRGLLSLVGSLFWMFVLLGVGYLLFRGVANGLRGTGADDPALAELRLAYARGDLSEEEYEKRRERLKRETEESR